MRSRLDEEVAPGLSRIAVKGGEQWRRARAATKGGNQGRRPRAATKGGACPATGRHRR
ncbi:MAG TPA: hypothetical protein VES60_07395 [Nakamurella sp.]|nr:hypothetical protein [Nakamurella sp.]